MTFANLPLATLGLLAAIIAGVVLALYLLRRTPRAQVVSNVAFWLEAQKRSRPKLLSATRIPLLSLLISLIVGLLLVTEIGGPRFGDGVRGTTVVVVGAGHSMGTEEDGHTRIDRAFDEVRRWVDRATASGEVAVVRAGIRPSVIMPLTDDDADLSRALSDFELDDGPSDLEGAVALAERIVEQRGGSGQVLVVADRAPDIRTRVPVVLLPVGGIADTLAITELSARRDPIAVGEYAVHAEVASFTSRSAQARLVIRDRDVVVFDQRFTIPAGERKRFNAQGFSSAQGELTANLEEIEIAGSEDMLASDDTAYALAAPLPATRVLLISAGNVYLEGVLAAHGAVEVDVIEPGAVASLDNGALGEHDVIVLDRASLPEGAEHGAVLTFGVGDGGVVEIEEQLDNPRVSASLASHPALGGVRLDAIRIERANALRPEPEDQVLLRSGRHALALARDRAGKRTVAFGFGLGESDLGERVAFPLTVHHSITWLARQGEEDVLPDTPGIALAAPAQTAVLDPEGEPLASESGWVDDTAQAGIYHVGERAVALSGATTAMPIPAPAPRVAPRGTKALPPLAVLIASGLLLLMLVEWGLMHRGKLA